MRYFEGLNSFPIPIPAMSRRKSPSVSIENSDDGLKILTEIANGEVVDHKEIDTALHEVIDHRYKMPCAHDVKEISDPCKEYAPELANQLQISYFSLYGSRLKLDAAKRKNKSAKEQAKSSLEYVKCYEAFSNLELAATKAIQEGIQRKAEELKNDIAYQ